MSAADQVRDPGQVEPGASPNELRDPLVVQEVTKAKVWFGAGLLVALAVLLIQPILVIFAGLMLAVMFDGGVRLLGRMLPVARGVRLLIVDGGPAAGADAGRANPGQRIARPDRAGAGRIVRGDGQSRAGTTRGTGRIAVTVLASVNRSNSWR